MRSDTPGAKARARASVVSLGNNHVYKSGPDDRPLTATALQ